jgi:hypothetical protein
MQVERRSTREIIARFESERQALALMGHPAIAKVFDAGSTPEGIVRVAVSDRRRPPQPRRHGWRSEDSRVPEWFQDYSDLLAVLKPPGIAALALIGSGSAQKDVRRTRAQMSVWASGGKDSIPSQPSVSPQCCLRSRLSGAYEPRCWRAYR